VEKPARAEQSGQLRVKKGREKDKRQRVNRLTTFLPLT
jgi:hypothetical protein